MKPTWDAYFMAMAQLASTRGTCDRKQVGAVLVREKRVLATGYNGAPRGWDNCDEVGHLLMDINGRQSCIRTIHAEHNAILQCALHGVSSVGATCYTTASPCFDCLKMLAQVGVREIVCLEHYDSARSGSVVPFYYANQNGILMRFLDGGSK